MRVLIADDEALARARLGAMLRQESAVDVVGECATGPDTIAAIHAGTPDVVFLDLQMPGCDGLTVAGQLPVPRQPAVVFVTGHDTHAVDAFRLGAADYLLKPFDQERLRQALQRAGEQVKARQAGALEAQIENILARSAAGARRPERLTLKLRGRIVFVAPEDISRIEAADNYVILHLVSGERHMLRESLQAVEDRIGSGRFMRANRSTLVQLEQIRELKSNAYGDHTLILRDGIRVPLSRKLRGQLEDLLGPHQRTTSDRQTER